MHNMIAGYFFKSYVAHKAETQVYFLALKKSWNEGNGPPHPSPGFLEVVTFFLLAHLSW